MSVLIVSYDLRQPGRNYEPLYQRLRAYTHDRPLESVWLLDTTSTTVQVRDNLYAVMDRNDGLLVAQLSGPSAWQNLKGSGGQFLRSRFGN